MNPVPRDTDEKTKKAIEEFLEKGGEIQYFEYGQRSENLTYSNSFYGKRNKQKDTNEGGTE